MEEEVQVVRCKMRCCEIQQFSESSFIYKFSAVCADEVPENQRYHKYTPSGKIEITVTNPNVKYLIGKDYYFDSVAAPK